MTNFWDLIAGIHRTKYGARIHYDRDGTASISAADAMAALKRNGEMDTETGLTEAQESKLAQAIDKLIEVAALSFTDNLPDPCPKDRVVMAVKRAYTEGYASALSIHRTTDNG